MTFVIVKASKRWSPEAREKEFQSALAECDELIKKGSKDREWYLVPLPDYCFSAYEEYSQRIDEEEKQQAIDKAAAKANINNGAAPEPPDTE